MIYLKRALYAIFFIPVFIIAYIFFVLCIIFYPIIGMFYYIKTGDVENTPIDPGTVPSYIIELYTQIEP